MTAKEPILSSFIRALYEARIEEERQAALRSDAALDASDEAKARGERGLTVTFRKVQS